MRLKPLDRLSHLRSPSSPCLVQMFEYRVFFSSEETRSLEYSSWGHGHSFAHGGFYYLIVQTQWRNLFTAGSTKIPGWRPLRLAQCNNTRAIILRSVLHFRFLTLRNFGLAWNLCKSMRLWRILMEGFSCPLFLIDTVRSQCSGGRSICCCPLDLWDKCMRWCACIRRRIVVYFSRISICRGDKKFERLGYTWYVVTLYVLTKNVKHILSITQDRISKFDRVLNFIDWMGLIQVKANQMERDKPRNRPSLVSRELCIYVHVQSKALL